VSCFTSRGENAICYSYLVTAISQYFFNILYRRKYLVTFRIHWLIIFVSWSMSVFLPLLLYLSVEYEIFLKILTNVNYFRCTSILIGNVRSMKNNCLNGHCYRCTLLWYHCGIATTASQKTSTRDLRVLKRIQLDYPVYFLLFGMQFHRRGACSTLSLLCSYD